MRSQKITPQAVDWASVSIIMDNHFDLLLSDTEVAKRMPLAPNAFEKPLPIAEHGFSVLITVERNGLRRKVLFDTGVSRKGLLHNLDALEISLKDVQVIVLSHGHADHAFGLPGAVDRLGVRGIPLILHPDAYLERKLVLPNGYEISLPPPKFEDLRREKVEVIEEIGPSMLVDDMILVSGEIARSVQYEQGFPIHFARRHDHWEPDPMIMDDQCAILNVRGEGLVIITGCGHAGIINTIRNAQAITGIQAVYAVIGGFHLSGPLFEPIIPATIAALKDLNPGYVMPGHCTGWRAAHAIALAMPEAYLQNSVGTTVVLGARDNAHIHM
jgi:7,8-dihydropterin-6-yl-methyl-4-(beta-D-ribofuranosyl)aminobenzene 5'-phosphate synthase